MSLLHVGEEALEVVVPLRQKPGAGCELAAGQLEGELHGVGEQIVELWGRKCTMLQHKTSLGVKATATDPSWVQYNNNINIKRNFFQPSQFSYSSKADELIKYLGTARRSTISLKHQCVKKTSCYIPKPLGRTTGA